jgi:hypothetical protein
MQIGVHNPNNEGFFEPFDPHFSHEPEVNIFFLGIILSGTIIIQSTNEDVSGCIM